MSIQYADTGAQAPLDLKRIPRALWAQTLAKVLVDGFRNHGDKGAIVLAEIVEQGPGLFIKRGLASDQFGLSRTDYEKIYRRLQRAYREMCTPD